ncbi:hypothetical protein [Clostridium perfringens]|uniref:hypothetical protein n=1 Tax=Clostridium perfringens TaxID=1502 RepID=UPI0010EED29A|nr:hypothetical protein [Clostridium perfringens]MCX0386830.1 hypothetical protein [Clostridium perfringens]MDU2659038.1 hypothetical protein [Clostridium perfringens]MDU7548502.1 hypothetical protein [Clostridium perfringens]WEV08571.1 hypothetical protein PL324_00720 [Clostridium perfringens B]VTQ54999.1 Uncharacterised protein [Clostridium perfringens]
MEILVILCTIISAMAMIISIIAMSTLKYLDNSKETSKNNVYDEVVEDRDDTFQKAIIFIGNEKIEIDVDYCYIDDATTRIESKDGKVYLTDIKNVVLISDKKEIF